MKPEIYRLEKSTQDNYCLGMKTVKPEKLGKVIGLNVKARRKELGYTQETVAAACDVSPERISQIEHFVGNVPSPLLALLSEALGCTVASLVTEGSFIVPEKLSRI